MLHLKVKFYFSVSIKPLGGKKENKRKKKKKKNLSFPIYTHQKLFTLAQQVLAFAWRQSGGHTESLFHVQAHSHLLASRIPSISC